MPELSEIRNAIDSAKVEQYLVNGASSRTVKGAPMPPIKGPITIKQFTFGQLNPTYLITDQSGLKLVLRRKPMANKKLVSRSAHAIEREFYMIKGIDICNAQGKAEHKVPVPKVYLLCEDESVIGQVFYVMEYMRGRPIKRPDMPQIEPEHRHAYWDAAMTTVGAIHLVDCSELVKHLPAEHFPQFQPERLAKLAGDGPSYFERQIKTLDAVHTLQLETVDAIPHFKQILEWVLARAPRDPTQLTLIHGDCKIDNFMFHESEPKVLAVLDWELCTLGHPLFDLANFLQPFVLPVAFNRLLFPDTNIGVDDPANSDHVKEVLTLYQERLGRLWRDNDPKNNPVDLWRVGSVFGLLRICVISQGVAMRVKSGTASSASAEMVAGLYEDLSRYAMELTESLTKL